MNTPQDQLKRLEGLAINHEELLILAEELISRHGIARNILEQGEKKHDFHDYLFLSLTKATKTFGSCHILLENLRGEDALILTRSIYECYLSVSFLFAHPEEIYSLVNGKVGLHIGEYKKKKNKIVNSESQEEIGSIISVGHMARNTRWTEDVEIHKFIYPYLCSFSHMDILTISQYLDGSNFTTTSALRANQARLYSFYFYVLLINEFVLFKGFTESEKSFISESLNTYKKAVTPILEYMNSHVDNGNNPSNFLDRWQHIAIGWIS